MNIISHFSYEDIFFIRSGQNVLSFGYKGLPKDVHFSIGYNPEKEELNLRVSRNNSSENKPKVEIARIQRKVLEDFLMVWNENLIGLILQPLPPKIQNMLWKGGERVNSFILLSPNQNKNRGDFLEDNLIEVFRQSSKIKGRKKVKVFKCIENNLIAFTRHPKNASVIQNKLTELPALGSHSIISGYINTHKFQGVILILEGKPYTFREDISIREFVETIMPIELASAITYNAVSAINRIKRANSRADVVKFEEPIILTFDLAAV